MDFFANKNKIKFIKNNIKKNIKIKMKGSYC